MARRRFRYPRPHQPAIDAVVDRRLIDGSGRACIDIEGGPDRQHRCRLGCWPEDEQFELRLALAREVWGQATILLLRQRWLSRSLAWESRLAELERGWKVKASQP